MKIDRGNFDGNINFIEKVKLLNSNQEILEIGSGMGKLLDFLKRNGYKAQGIEINDKYIKYAKNNFGLDITKTAGASLKFDDGIFDVVLSFDVFEHIPNSDFHLREVKRVLKKEGYFLLQTPNKFTNIPFEIIKERSFKKYKEYHCSLHSYWELKKRFNEAGFCVRFVKIPVVNTHFKEKIRKYLGRFGLVLIKIINPDKFPLWLRTNFYIVAQLKK